MNAVTLPLGNCLLINGSTIKWEQLQHLYGSTPLPYIFGTLHLPDSDIAFYATVWVIFTRKPHPADQKLLHACHRPLFLTLSTVNVTPKDIKEESGFVFHRVLACMQQRLQGDEIDSPMERRLGEMNGQHMGNVSISFPESDGILFWNVPFHLFRVTLTFTWIPYYILP